MALKNISLDDILARNPKLQGDDLERSRELREKLHARGVRGASFGLATRGAGRKADVERAHLPASSKGSKLT